MAKTPMALRPVCFVFILGWAGMVAGCGGAPLTAREENSSEQSQRNSIAVVDMQKVFGSLKERSEIDARLVSRRDGLDKLDYEKSREIKALEADLTVLAPDSSLYKQTQVKLDQKRKEYEAWQKKEKEELEREKAFEMESLYRKAISAIEREAKTRKYDLVLYKETSMSLARVQTQQQMATIIQLRQVLYAAPELDITARIIEVLNKEYSGAKGGSNK